MSVYEIHRMLSVREIVKVEGITPQVEREAEAAFIQGDADAAFGLSCSLSNHNRGTVAVMMWRGRVKREAFAAYFASVWSHDHRHVIRAAQTRRRLTSMFRYAAFEPPAGTPDRLTVWRGTSKLSMRQALRGFSWTTDRDVACWFAMRFAERNSSPLVLRADIHRDDVALFDDCRSEREAVLMRPPAAFVDGDAADWAVAHARQQAAISAHNRNGGKKPVSPAPD